MVDRRNNFVWLTTMRDEEPVMLTQHLSDTDSMLASVADPNRAPEMLAVREGIRGWRFYDQFRTDADSPARAAQIGTFTPVLHHDGSNLAAALQTILELRSDEALATTLEDAFPGSRLQIDLLNGRFELQIATAWIAAAPLRGRVIGWHTSLSPMDGGSPYPASTRTYGAQ